MSWNEVRIDENGNPLLFDEERIFYQTVGVGLQYENGDGYPGSGQALNSASGRIFLSNIRVIYVPDKINSILSSFSAPLENLIDIKLSTGWISGGNIKATVKSVAGHRFSNEFGHVVFEFTSNPREFKDAYSHLRSKLGTNPIPYQESLPNYQNLISSETPPNYSSGV